MEHGFNGSNRLKPIKLVEIFFICSIRVLFLFFIILSYQFRKLRDKIMSQPKIYDVGIIGGGIVGTATAMALQEVGIHSVLVLEAENKLAAHQTGNNSGVIHSGLYYKPGSLKAHNCVEGRELMYRFCEQNNINHDRCGKLVVALKPEEIPLLQNLEERGIANGLKGIKKLNSEELKEYEPHVRGLAGLFIAETGIVDYNQVTETYAKIIMENGGEVKTKSKFLALHKENGVLVIATIAGEYKAKFLVSWFRLFSYKPAIRFKGERIFL